MLEAKRADIYKELEEINLRLFGWNRTLNVGEEFFEAKMENQDRQLNNVTQRNERTKQKEEELAKRPKTFFEKTQSLEKPTAEKIIQDKNHGLDYLRSSRFEHLNEKKLHKLFEQTDIDMVEQLRKEKQTKSARLQNKSMQEELERIKHSVNSARYDDLQLQIQPSLQL